MRTVTIMGADERRTKVLCEDSGEWGKVRVAKVSSLFDRRRRYLVVEWCPPGFVGTDREKESLYIQRRWHPASTPENLAAAVEFYCGFREGLIISLRDRVAEA